MPYLQLFVAKKREKKRNIYENDCNISGKSVLLENLFCSSDMYERFFIIIFFFFCRARIMGSASDESNDSE